MRLKARAVIVTGGATGLGRVFARRLLAEGARVMIADVVDPVDAVFELGTHGEVAGVVADVADAAAARAMAEFLASPDSAFMTGQTLVVDGGSIFL